MPEYPQFPFSELTFTICLYCLIHSQILMIPSQNLDCFPIGMVEQNKVFIEIKEILFFTDTTQHGLKFNASLIVFR